MKTQQSDWRVWSFFSGAMGLDLGFGKVFGEPELIVEKDKWCRETIKMNAPDIPLAGADISKFRASDVGLWNGKQGEIDIFIGGPPCQTFSTGGLRAGLNDSRGNMIYEYLRVIEEVRPKYFVLENVASITSAALKHRPIADRPGQHWSLKRYSAKQYDTEFAPEERSGSALNQILDDIEGLGYATRFNVLDASDYGAAQKRLRFVMIGALDRLPPELPAPTYGDGLNSPKRTLADAIGDLVEAPGPHSIYTEEVAKYFRVIPPGGNWRHLPEELKREAMGASYAAGGGKTGFFRRLAWDQPAPTITGRANRKASAICHPNDVRPLSVRECARVQGFPDDWQFSGSMSQKYLQIGNAVPVALGYAVAAAIKQTCDKSELELPSRGEMLKDAQLQITRAARNKRVKKEQSGDLFAERAAE